METWSTIYALDITLKVLVAAPVLFIAAVLVFGSVRMMVLDRRFLVENIISTALVIAVMLSPLRDALGFTEDGLPVFIATTCMASVLFTSLMFGWWDRRRGRRG